MDALTLVRQADPQKVLRMLSDGHLGEGELEYRYAVYRLLTLGSPDGAPLYIVKATYGYRRIVVCEDPKIFRSYEDKELDWDEVLDDDFGFRKTLRITGLIMKHLDKEDLAVALTEHLVEHLQNKAITLDELKAAESKILATATKDSESRVSGLLRMAFTLYKIKKPYIYRSIEESLIDRCSQYETRQLVKKAISCNTYDKLEEIFIAIYGRKKSYLFRSMIDLVKGHMYWIDYVEDSNRTIFVDWRDCSGSKFPNIKVRTEGKCESEFVPLTKVTDDLFGSRIVCISDDDTTPPKADMYSLIAVIGKMALLDDDDTEDDTEDELEI